MNMSWNPAHPTVLLAWQNFYVIVGSAAAALTGLQFVVIALFFQVRTPTSPVGIDAFATPTIVYFSTVLLVAAAMCAPWGGLAAIAVLIALIGVEGVTYAALIARRAIRQSGYKLVFEDWLWHVGLPLTAHSMLLGAGLALAQRTTGALFTVGAATLLLLFIGIHNAWDTSTYVVVQNFKEVARNAGDAKAPPAAHPPPSPTSSTPPTSPTSPTSPTPPAPSPPPPEPEPPPPAG